MAISLKTTTDSVYRAPTHNTRLAVKEPIGLLNSDLWAHILQYYAQRDTLPALLKARIVCRGFNRWLTPMISKVFFRTAPTTQITPFYRSLMAGGERIQYRGGTLDRKLDPALLPDDVTARDALPNKSIILGHKDGSFTLWTGEGERKKAPIQAHAGRIRSIEPMEQNLFVTASNNEVKVWNSRDLTELQELWTGHVYRQLLVFRSKDCIVIQHDTTIYFYRASTGEMTATVQIQADWLIYMTLMDHVGVKNGNIIQEIWNLDGTLRTDNSESPKPVVYSEQFLSGHQIDFGSDKLLTLKGPNGTELHRCILPDDVDVIFPTSEPYFITQTGQALTLWAIDQEPPRMREIRPLYTEGVHCFTPISDCCAIVTMGPKEIHFINIRDHLALHAPGE